MEKICKDLREHVMRTVKYEKKEITPLTDEEDNSYEKQKVCYICKKEFNTDDDYDDDDNDDDNKKYHTSSLHWKN